MSANVSFTHVLNPFPARAGSEHAVASALTWRALRAAAEAAAEAGVPVRWNAVVLPGDEAAVEAPATLAARLGRSVQDIAPLKPRRPLPLVGDILAEGARDATTSHVVFSNMDIAPHRDFYPRLRSLIVDELGPDVPFTVPRLNVDPALADAPLQALYEAPGTPGNGYDCFVMPTALAGRLDLGACCVGAGHFDLLMVMALDLLSGHRMRTLSQPQMTYHLGNDIAWAAMIEYLEHNLAESLAAIARMRQAMPVAPGSRFDSLDRRHFQRNAAWTSAWLRRIRRLPLVGSTILQVKRMVGRQY